MLMGLREGFDFFVALLIITFDPRVFFSIGFKFHFSFLKASIVKINALISRINKFAITVGFNLRFPDRLYYFICS